MGDYERVLKHMEDGDNVVFGVPLYVDGIPSHVLAFMKVMETYCREKSIKLNVYVVSNGGFIEGCQNKALMQIFENFCHRCNFQWCGGVGVSGGVMLSVMRIMFFVYIVLFLLNILMAGMSAISIFAEQLIVISFLSSFIFEKNFNSLNVLKKMVKYQRKKASFHAISYTKEVPYRKKQKKRGS